jgi:iron(III) transport system permease protein
VRLNRRLLEAAFPDEINRLPFDSGHFTLEFFKYFYTDALTRQSILNSLALGCVVTVLTAAIALPLSVVVVRYRFPAKSLLTGLLLLPMIMPPFVGAIGMRQVLARFGSLNLLLLRAGLIGAPVDWLGGARFWGVVILEVLHLYPIMYLNFAAALANVDPSLEEAAVNMGSSGLGLFRRITLPLMMPGLFAGSVIVFIWAFTDLGTPLIFGYTRVVPVQIFNQVIDLSRNPQGYALVVGVLAMTVLIYLTAKRTFGLRAYQSLTRGPVQGSEKRPGRLASSLMVLFILAVVGLACLPHGAVILTALKREWFMSVLPTSYTLGHFESALGHELTLSSIRNSILFSGLSTALDLALGVVIGYLLVRHAFRGSSVLDALVMLPLAIPGLVLAFGYVAAFSSVPLETVDNPFYRALLAARNALDPRDNPIPLLVIAYGVRRLPYMVRAAYAGFQQVNVQLEEAAVNLGSPPLKAMVRVTVPLLSANLVAGGILVFSFAMLEVSDSLILAMKEEFYPITKAIYVLVQRIEDGPYIASALGVWAMVFLGVSLMAAGILLGRRMGQLFRA